MRLPLRRRVRTYVRSLLVLVMLAGSASADVGFGLFGQATRYDGQPLGTGGLTFEASLDRGRWQYLTEVSIAAVNIGDDSFPENIVGTQYRGGVGVRYLARKFMVENAVGFELGFEGIVAAQDIEWSNGDRDVRPELDVGFAWNIHYGDTVTSRWSVRAFFAPAPTSTMACRGSCPPTDAITSGYMLVMGLTW